MKLASVHLKNVACFEDISFDFTTPSGKPASWVVLLGENGTGKSTLLKMLALTLIGATDIFYIPGLPFLGDMVRKVPGGEGSESLPSALAEATLTQGGFAPVLNSVLLYAGRSPAPIEFPQWRIDGVSTVFACGYSPWRRPPLRTQDTSATPLTAFGQDSGIRAYRFATLFDLDRLRHVDEWLTGLLSNSLFPEFSQSHRDTFRQRYDRACQALAKFIGVERVSYNANLQTLFHTTDGAVTFSQLSDGYRGMLAWGVDLISRLFDAYPDSEDPLNESGIVLLDEIDLHLHPVWQRSVVETVRRTFPNLQFIVTSHSPFVAQDMRAQDRIIVLERNKRTGIVQAREDAGIVQDWSADQIFSAYFGLQDGTRGERVQRKEARYQRLLEAESKGSLTEKQNLELARLRHELRRVPLGDTLEEHELYTEADRVLEALRTRRLSLEKQRNGESPKNGSA